MPSMLRTSSQTTMSLTRIAHLSDIHLLDETREDRVRARSYDLSTRFVSIGRRLDPEERRRKLEYGLRAARRAGAHHFVLSGDLTEMGTKAQYEALAETLHDSAIEPWRITLVPGNHDAYDSPTAWRDALDGVLRPWAPTSARNAGAVVDIGRVCLLPGGRRLSPARDALIRPHRRRGGRRARASHRRSGVPSQGDRRRPAPPAVRALHPHAVARRSPRLGPDDEPHRALPGRTYAPRAPPPRREPRGRAWARACLRRPRHRR